MNKNGGYMWIQTCATVVCSIKSPDEQNIICVNYIVTNREHPNMILDQCQLGIIKREPIVYPKIDNDPKSPHDNHSHNGDNSPHESKGCTKLLNSSENKSLENSSKDAKNCDDDAAVSSKRGRKRKVKSEAKEQETTDITVKELENVMSKHLPKSIEGSTDFSTDTLLRNADVTADKSSTFGNFPSNSTPMPATALLRQLYANRESVIRATSRPSNYMYSDTHQQSLPTPPNDSSYSSDSQYLINSRKTEAFNYSGAYSSMDYNNAMTPPSSVSPRDLTNHKTTNYEYTNLTTSSSGSNGDARLQYQTNDNSQHLPLKPQPYSLHQMDHHSSSYGIDHQSQYFSPYHTGFHLYHKNIYTPP